MPRKTKKKSSNKRKRRRDKIDIEQILLQKRQLFVFGEINEKLAYHITRQLVALAQISDEPIAMYINSPGGGVDDGFAIIDCMKGLAPMIITLVVGSACSMAGLISIAGDKRMMTTNSIWMAHDLRAGIIDYASKIEDRAEYYKKEQAKLFKFLRDHTKLSEKEIQKAIHGELWVYPEECLKKGIIDEIAGAGR